MNEEKCCCSPVVKSIDTKQDIVFKLDITANIKRVHDFIQKMTDFAVDGWTLKSISLVFGEEYTAHFEKVER